MGPRGKYRGIGGVGGLNVQAPPLTPESGSGGPGPLGGIGQTVNVRPALSEISDVTTGRITLGMVNLTVLLMIGFYVWTRSAQGGG